MYKASIIVTLSNEYALTENFFSNLSFRITLIAFINQ